MSRLNTLTTRVTPSLLALKFFISSHSGFHRATTLGRENASLLYYDQVTEGSCFNRTWPRCQCTSSLAVKVTEWSGLPPCGTIMLGTHVRGQEALCRSRNVESILSRLFTSLNGPDGSTESRDLAIVGWVSCRASNVRVTNCRPDRTIEYTHASTILTLMVVPVQLPEVSPSSDPVPTSLSPASKR